jgi:hypothetical protein
MIFKGFSLVVALIVSGCAANVEMKASSIADATYATSNKHESTSWVEGPFISSSIFENNQHSYYMRTLIQNRDHNAIQHQIYVSALFGDWAFLSNAQSYGASLDVIKIDRRFETCTRFGCAIREDVAINLPDAVLRTYVSTGFGALISGRSGSVEIFIPSEYILGYLQKLDSLSRQ